jgi:hypothetical protein
MSAFYRMDYVGQIGAGGGAIYIGKGVVFGIDVVGSTYDGAYSEAGGRLKGNVRMTTPVRGAILVAGQRMPGGAAFDLSFDLGPDFASGRPQRIFGVGGRPIQVTFKKLKDLP